MTNINVAWWNLENLFDHEDAIRDAELKSKLKHELKDWTEAIRDKKISQLVSIIKLMFAGEGPALLGVCEVENEDVVELLAKAIDLPGREYEVIHHKSDDARGIDVSFIYDKKVLDVVSHHHQVIIKRTATRDIFWVRLKVTSADAEFVAIANHWPARSAGVYASEPFRILAGETHAYIVSKLIEEDKNLPIISMGDFNDEPFNRSIREYALCSRDPGRVRYSRSGHLLNLMWPLIYGHDPGTYIYGSNWNMLDQFMVSYGMLCKAGKVRVEQTSTAIFKPDIMKVAGGKAHKFGRPSAKGFDQDGYSDHFPITVKLIT